MYLKLHKKKEDVHQFLFCPNCRLTLQNEEVVLKHKQFHKDFPNSAYVNQGYTEQTKISHSTINKVFNPNLIQKVKKNPEKLSLAAKRLVKVTLKGQDTKAEDVLIKNHNGILAVSKYSKESWSATEINIELLDRRFGNNKFLINETFDPLDESLKQLHELERMRIRK